MRYGCCTNLLSKHPGGTGVECIGAIAEAGYDYVELPLAQLMVLPEAEFKLVVEQLRKAGLPCEACNNFLPASLRLTGPEVQPDLIMAYVRRAVARAADLGAKTIVFGSSGAKNIPAGFAKEKAWRQVVGFLQEVAAVTELFGMIVAIEPLNKSESNLINTYREGVVLAEEVNRPSIRLLIDYYHLAVAMEDPSVLAGTGSLLAHVHIARPLHRVFPINREEDAYGDFFRQLCRIGYDGRISLEAYPRDLSADLAVSLKMLRQLNESSDQDR
jgi:D-psicose/D-tagatose/L-ribulose 3-epimerase